MSYIEHSKKTKHKKALELTSLLNILGFKRIAVPIPSYLRSIVSQIKF